MEGEKKYLLGRLEAVRLNMLERSGKCMFTILHWSWSSVSSGWGELPWVQSQYGVEQSQKLEKGILESFVTLWKPGSNLAWSLILSTKFPFLHKQVWVGFYFILGQDFLVVIAYFLKSLGLAQETDAMMVWNINILPIKIRIFGAAFIFS